MGRECNREQEMNLRNLLGGAIAGIQTRKDYRIQGSHVDQETDQLKIYFDMEPTELLMN